MNATIFTTTEIENGIIKIPQKYQKDIGRKYKITVIIEATEEQKTTKKKQEFKSLKLKTKGFKFDREEAHER